LTGRSRRHTFAAAHSLSKEPIVPKTLPPGPKGHWLLGNLPDIRRDQLGFHLSCAREYGDVVPARLANRRVVYVFHPDLIEEVLVTRNRDFGKGLFLDLLKPIFGNGLLLSEGDSWLRQRRLVQPGFHRQRIAAYGQIMTALTEERLRRWKDGDTLDIHAEMMTITQAIVAKTLFDADVTDDRQSVGDAVQAVMTNYFVGLRRAIPVPRWLPTAANLSARRAIRQLDAVVYRMIATRRASGEDRGDVLSMLLHAQDADDGSRMTDQQVRDEVMTLFLAGHETTAVALSWTWYLLTQAPEAEAKLAEELHTVLGGRTPTIDDLPRLRFTEMVVTESMRLYPPAYAISRRTLRACEVGGYLLPPDITVVIPIRVVQRDPRWFDEPERFHPGRWANDAAKLLPRFAYFPFGGGPRQCIGNTFAMMEAVLLLAMVAQRFRLQLVQGQTVRATPYITLRPEPGIRMLIGRR
jgi:cytochrome P450